ncbi:MAG: hypothetical protein HYV17_08070 [Xanthomonadales bacterium]|nr:hypothetical protein [Xanthomonadales bacterium]
MNEYSLAIVIDANGKAAIGEFDAVTGSMVRLHDAAELLKDQVVPAGEAATAASKKFGALGDSIEKNVIRGAKGGAIALAGLIGLQVDAADKAGKLAEKLGVSTEWISGMGYAADASGSNLKSLSDALGSLSVNATNAVRGKREQVALFEAMGVSASDAAGGVRSLDQLLPAIADKFAGMQDGPGKAALALKLFGSAGRELIPYLNDGSAGLDVMRQRAAELGLVISGETAAGAAELKDNIDLLKANLQGMANDIMRAVLPALVDITSHTSEIIGLLELLGTIAGTVYAGKLVRGALDYASALVDLVTKNQAVAAAETARGAASQTGLMASIKSVGALQATFGLLQAGVVGWSIGTYLREQFVEARLFGIAFVEGVLVGWERIKQFGSIAWAGVRAAFFGAINLMRDELADFVGMYASAAAILPDKFGGAAIKGKLAEWQAALRPATSAATEFAKEVKAVDDAFLAEEARIKTITGDMADYELAAEAAKHQTKGLTEETKKAPPPLVAIGDASADAAEKLKQFQEKVDGLVESLLVNRDAEEDLTLMIALEEAARAGQTERVEELTRALEKLHERQLDDLEATKTAAEFIAEINKQYETEVRLAGMSAEQRRIETQVLNALNQAHQNKIDMTPQQIADLRAVIAAGEANITNLEAQQLAVEDNARAWDDFTGGLADAALQGAQGVKRWWNQMIDDMKRQLIQSGLLRLFGSIFNTGGAQAGGSLLGSLFSGASGASGSGSGASSLLSMFGSGSGGNGLMSTIAGWFGAGAGGAGAGLGFSGVAASGLQAGMTNLGYGAIPNYAGGAAVSGGAAAGGQGAALGGLGAAGIAAIVVIAAMVNDKLYGQGWRSHGGDLALRSGTSVHGGGSSNVGLGALGQPNAMTEGLLRRLGLSDRVSSLLTGMGIHTRLFGRKAPQFERQDTNLTFGAGGVGGNMVDHVIERGGLFRSNRRSVHNTGLGEEQRSAAEAIMEIITGAMQDAARMLKADPPDVLNSAIREVTKFDKKGKATGSEIFVDILGRTFKEADIDHATMRIAAENILATLDKSIAEAATAARPAASAEAIAKILAPERDIGDGPGGPGRVGGPGEQVAAAVTEVQAIAERWRSSAEDLLAGANFLVLAQTQIAAGNNLLGAGGSLTEITDLVEEMARGEESLSDTFARLFASTELVRSSFELIDSTINTSGAAFVEWSQDFVDAAGGLDAASALFNDYMANFYSAAERNEQALAALVQSRSSSLEGIGLDPDTTAEQFRAQFEAALSTLSPEDTVAWLEAARAMALLDTALEAVAQQAIEAAMFTQSLGDAVMAQEGGMYTRERVRIERATAGYIADANAIARARGEEGASARDLALIHRWASNEYRRALAQFEAGARDLISSLGYDALSLIEHQIAEAEAAQAAANSQSSAIGAVDDAATSMFERWRDGIISLNQYLDSLLTGSNSPLSIEDRMAEAQRQLDAALGAAGRGDVDALNSLPQIFDAYMAVLREMEASGTDSSGPILQYIEQMRALGVNPYAPTGGGTPGTVQLVPSPELEALYARQRELQAQYDAAERAMRAQELAAYLIAVTEISGETIFAAGERLGVNFEQFLTDLGATTTATTADQIVALGLVANTLAVELPELAEHLGLSLGALNDTQSLLNDALELTINGLPEGIRDQLLPAFDQLQAATTPEEVEAALDRLAELTNALPEEFRMQLAPYLANVDPITDATFDDLDFLSGIDENTAASRLLLGHILDEMRGTATPPAAPQAPAPTSAVGGDASAGTVYAKSFGDPGNQVIVDEVRAMRTSITVLAEVVEERLRAHERATVDSQSEAAQKVSESVDQLGRTGALVRNG